MSEQEKNYAKGAWVYEKTFQSTGNTIHTITGNAEEFAAWVMSIADSQGRFRIGMSRRREIIDKKPTHTLWQDTWQPGQQRNPQPSRANEQAAEQQRRTYDESKPAGPDNLPF